MSMPQAFYFSEVKVKARMIERWARAKTRSARTLLAEHGHADREGPHAAVSDRRPDVTDLLSAGHEDATRPD
jgi:hypothetical protein